MDVGTVLAGKYKLVRQVGEGGMGVVYQAVRLDSKQTVAVKLVKPGMDSKDVLARFDAERQALSAMNHANIAKVLDAGLTPAGRPFFVMEFVRGEPITQYCDQQQLTTNHRLELFRQVCEAVQHAHQKGIIHRDIKPTNVLAEVIDGKPVPKVIDFGLAKAMSHKLTDKTLVSELGKTVGTLLYSSPEQAAGRVNEIDTRTDIYSLGVVLYEMLAGELPFTEAELLLAGDAVMKGKIAHAEPPKPSVKLSSSNALPRIAANRQIDPVKLPRLVRGELDLIVMKALEKDPNRRYASATGFADDVKRYLAGERVEAMPPSMSYRLRKFVRKNRGPVIAVSLLVLALTAGMIGTGVGLSRARQARNDEANQRQFAQEQERLARQRRIEAEAAGQLADRRRVEAETAGQLADRRRIEAESARDHARQRFQLALDAFNQMVFGIQDKLEDRPGTQELRKDLLENARAGLRQLLKEAEKEGNPDSTLVWSHLRFGDVELNLGNTEAAQQAYEQGHELAKNLAAADARNAAARNDLSVCVDKLGDVMERRGQTHEAIDLYLRGLNLRRILAEAAPENNLLQRDLFVSYLNLGRMTFRLGRTKEALEYFTLGAEILKKQSAEHAQNARTQRDLFVSFSSLGGVTLALGQTQKALDFHKQSLAVCEKLAAADPQNSRIQRDLGMCYGNLGDVTLALRRHEEALTFHKQSMSIRRQLASDDPRNASAQNDLSQSLSRLADASLRTGRTGEALDFLKQSLSIRQKLAEYDPKNLQAQTALYFAYHQLGEFEQSQLNFQEAIRWHRIGRLVLLPWHEQKLLSGSDRDLIAVTDRRISDCHSAEQAVKDLESVFKDFRESDKLMEIRVRALLKQNKRDEAVASAERYARSAEVVMKGWPARTSELYLSACLWSLCAMATEPADGKLLEKCLNSLVKCRELGRFASDSDVQEFLQDTRFDGLRNEAAFQTFVKSLPFRPAKPDSPRGVKTTTK